MTAALHLPERDEWTVDDLSELPPDLHYELINGRLLVAGALRPPHQDLGVRVLLALEASCPADHLAVTDLSVQVNRHNEPCPDVVAIRIDHADRGPVPVGDVVLAVEIISPSRPSVTWSRRCASMPLPPSRPTGSSTRCTGPSR